MTGPGGVSPNEYVPDKGYPWQANGRSQRESGAVRMRPGAAVGLSCLDMRASATAASIATGSGRSSSRSTSSATISRVARSGRPLPASPDRDVGVARTRSLPAGWISAAATAILSPGPWMTLQTRSLVTAWAHPDHQSSRALPAPPPVQRDYSPWSSCHLLPAGFRAIPCSGRARESYNVIEKRVACGAEESVSVVTAGVVPARYGGPPHARLHYQCR